MNTDELRKKAEGGSVVAQSILGICYLEGNGVEANFEEAIRLLSAASSAGAPRAMTALARMYAEGLAMPKNLDEAIRLYTAAAERGEFDAQIALGRIYASGPNENSTLAKKWYASALEQQRDVQESAEVLEAKRFVNRTTRT